MAIGCGHGQQQGWTVEAHASIVWCDLLVAAGGWRGEGGGRGEAIAEQGVGGSHLEWDGLGDAVMYPTFGIDGKRCARRYRGLAYVRQGLAYVRRGPAVPAQSHQ